MLNVLAGWWWCCWVVNVLVVMVVSGPVPVEGQ